MSEIRIWGTLQTRVSLAWLAAKAKIWQSRLRTTTVKRNKVPWDSETKAGPGFSTMFQLGVERELQRRKSRVVFIYSK